MTPLKVIVLDLKGSSVPPSDRSALSSLVTVSLSDFSLFEVVSGADVRELTDLEANKETAGCNDASGSCFAEIAGALGARLVVFGQVEKLGSHFVMTLNLQDTRVGANAGRVALQADDVDALAAALPDGVKKMIMPFLEHEHLQTGHRASNTAVAARSDTPNPAPPAGVESPAAETPVAAIALAGGGAAVVVVGAVVAGFGIAPFFALQGKLEQLRGFRAAFASANVEDQRAIATDAAQLQAQTAKDVDGWNKSGQFVFVASVASVAVGVTLVGIGVPWLMWAE